MLPFPFAQMSKISQKETRYSGCSEVQLQSACVLHVRNQLKEPVIL